jgi:23S rRNA pseudouridine1911/1915/1917 synthase
MFKEDRHQNLGYCKGQPQPSGTLVHYIIMMRRSKSFCSAEPKPAAKKAVLHYTVIGQSERYFWLEVNLETGRHHQIRCQLAHIGCPIKGDLKYGYPRSNENGGISLHARNVRFVHPVRKESVSITADPDTDDVLWKFFLDRMAEH